MSEYRHYDAHNQKRRTDDNNLNNIKKTRVEIGQNTAVIV